MMQMQVSRPRPATALAFLFALAAVPPAPAQGQVQRVKDTVHNLSVSGPGPIRASGETEVCIFCHTPHNASLEVRPLWNRSVSHAPYTIYQSSSMRARPGQPTGSSKLCLSCHDGTIALGSVLSRDVPIALQGGVTVMPQGPSNLGTDLSDDHPISFSYDAAVGTGNPELLSPGAILPPVDLDRNGEVQCTSCHEPHDNSFGKFLVRPNESSALCRSCHTMQDWSSSAHGTSAAPVTADVAALLGAEVAATSQNACRSCHATHGAEGRPWLLARVNITSTCIACHSGRVARWDIEGEMRKLSGHGLSTEGIPALHGSPYLEGNRVSCADCHDPHSSGALAGNGAELPASIRGVEGRATNGTPVAAIRAEHELCFRCHGDSPARARTRLTRVITQDNKRLQFQSENPSFHPVGVQGTNPNVPSLLPPLLTTSRIACGDCHSSDGSRKLGGTAPAGPHGSIYQPLLALRYDTTDFSVESPAAYALCYRCHQRESILSDTSFKEHRKHIVEERTPCSVCHDPHGISAAEGNRTANAALMNFDRSIVFPNRDGRLEYVKLGTYRGECYLSCHGEDHHPEGY